MNLFRKKPALKPIHMCENFTQVAEAHERLRAMVTALQDVLPENTRAKGRSASNFESAELLEMMTRSIPSGPRSEFSYSSAGYLSYGLRMFQGAGVDSLFKQPEYLSKIMDFIETSHAAGAISPYEEMQSICQLAYASAADVYKEHDKKRARENVAHILDRLSESRNFYATSGLALIQQKQFPKDVTAAQIIKCLSKIEKNQTGLTLSEAEKAYKDNVFSMIMKDILTKLPTYDPRSFYTLSQVAAMVLPGDCLSNGQSVWNALINFEGEQQRLFDEAEKHGGRPERLSVPPLSVLHFLD